MSSSIAMLSAALAALAAGGACHGPRGERAVAGSPPASASCAVMMSRCSRCHDLDRIDRFGSAGGSRWDVLVDRMRRQPASGISLADRDAILTCLIDRASGRDRAGAGGPGAP